MTKTQQVIQAANIAYEKYTELEARMSREEAAKISFEVLQVEMEKIKMKTTRVDGYFKHGCNFTGKLVVIDYSDDWQNHPRYGEFGGMAVFDALENAKESLKEKYPNHDILLSIPDLVARIK